MRAVALLVLVAACRAPGAAAPSSPYEIGRGITVPRATLIIDLPESQRYRFVAPDVLVRGLSDEDFRSAMTPEAALLRETVTTVLVSHDWTEVVDSADYDVTVFLTRRTRTRSETRTEPVPTRQLPLCDMTRAPPRGQRCTTRTEPAMRTVTVQVPYTETTVYHVVRRRADGAVKWWAHQLDVESARAAVATDLLRLLLSSEGA